MASPCFTALPGLLPTCEPRRCHTPVTMRSSKRRTKRPRTKDGQGASGPAPARINVDSGTPSLRTQLKIIKAARAASGDGQALRHTHTAYRRKKPDGVVWAESRAKREAAQALPSGKYTHGERPLCYVDGYNLIGFWPRLRKHRDKGDWNEARRLLISILAEFTHLRGWDVVVVFDAYRNDNPMTVDKTDHSNVVIVYTGSDSADAFIERAVYTQVEAGKRQIWAVTNDHDLLTYAASKGAHHLSTSMFVSELQRARVEAVERAQLSTKEEARRSAFLQSSVDVNTRNALYQLRAELDGAA